jgi:hypothetical protein
MPTVIVTAFIDPTYRVVLIWFFLLARKSYSYTAVSGTVTTARGVHEFRKQILIIGKRK